MTQKDLKVFQSPRYTKLADKHPDLKTVASEFKKYKLSDTHADFGRDELYDEPDAVRMSGLRHAHLIPQKGWPRTAKRKFDQTSDRALVYCQSTCGKYCLLFAFLDESHDQAWKAAFMTELAEEAEAFFKQLGVEVDADHHPDE